MNKKVIAVIIVAMIIILAVIGVIVIKTNSNNTDSKKMQESNSQNNNEEKVIKNNSENEIKDNENQPNEQDKESTNSKILVAYFSKSGENYGVGIVDKGNTAIMAENIANEVGADLFEIAPIEEYPSSYEDAKTVAQQEQKENARPEIKNKVQNIDDYDVIFIGYPIWYGDYPMIINTFLESYDFSNKTIIPFNTHEGSGVSGTYDEIKNKLTNSNVITNGLAMRGSEAREDTSKTTIKNWVKELNF